MSELPESPSQEDAVTPLANLAEAATWLDGQLALAGVAIVPELIGPAGTPIPVSAVLGRGWNLSVRVAHRQN